MAKAAAKKPEKNIKKSGRRSFIVGALILGIASLFMVPTVVLLSITLIPTYVAFATDSDPQKSGAVSVGAMNFAGTVPFIIDLWSKGQTMENAFHLLSEANTWVVILGAAAIGQLVVYAIPQAIASLTLSHAESRVKGLRKNLDSLKDSWGPEVATNKPIEKIGQE